MQIAGIQKTTLVDYPGKVAATIFTRGCSFRCGFCHNPELVIPEKFSGILFDEGELFSFLESRIGKLEAVCITGGEPMIQSDIAEFIHKVKEMGFLVKLDTNGSRPTGLAPLISSGDVDYIAMDIKTTLSKYSKTTGLSFRPRELCRTIGEILPKDPSASVGMTDDKDTLIQNIKKSISLIMNSGIDYEFRTTVCHPLHEVGDFEEIGKLIQGAKRYYIQNFVETKQIDEKIKYDPFEDEELEEARETMRKYVKEAGIR